MKRLGTGTGGVTPPLRLVTGDWGKVLVLVLGKVERLSLSLFPLPLAFSLSLSQVPLPAESCTPAPPHLRTPAPPHPCTPAPPSPMALPINTFFDESYYLFNNLDVYAGVLKGEIRSGADHFSQYGARESRDPSQVFSSSFYLSKYQDVAAAVANGSVRSAYDHFLQFGAREGRDPIPLFSSSFYLSQYQDVAAAVANGSIRSAFDHFLQSGAKEGRDSGPLFNTSLYLGQNQDVAAAVAAGQITAFEHLISLGQNEDRPGVLTNSFNIEFDYRFDTNGFFAAPARRAVLEAAANIWESYILDEFKNIPAGTQFTIASPQTGIVQPVTLTSEIDDLLVFVGAGSPPFGEIAGALAASTPEGYDAAGSVYNARLYGSKFQPFVGTISFDSSLNWFFDPTLNTSNDIPINSTDFFSTALHEIAHILGIGTAEIFQNLAVGASFNGPNSRNINGGQPIPLEGDLSHLREDFLSDGQPALMDPTYPDTRLLPTTADLAVLSDIGYRISNFQPQGSTLPISTMGDDTTFGTLQSDIINGYAGSDYILADKGADLIRGGAGDDIVSGEDGNDILFGDNGNDEVAGGFGDDVITGGAGNDSLIGDAGRDRFIYESGSDRISDFRVVDDILQVSSALGFRSGTDVFRAITETGRAETGLRYSVVTLNLQNEIIIYHDTNLTAANFTVI